MSSTIIAIDGPAGSGKSSVSKQVARDKGFAYLDTGAAYRALAWASVHLPGFKIAELSTKNLELEFEYQISTDPDNYWVKVGNQDVTLAIREAQVVNLVSEVARIPEVRDYMKTLTRSLIRQSDKPGIVVEGRDITTVVAPDAPVRILLTASEAVRLKRRSAELSESDVASVMSQVADRDTNDSKVVDFLTPAPGVQLVDTSDLNFNESVLAVIALIEQGLS